jgi:hypothetical protein
MLSEQNRDKTEGSFALWGNYSKQEDFNENI